MRQMPMTTEMTTLHRTSPLAWHCTLSTLTSTSTESAHQERAQTCSLCTFITLTLAQVRALSAPHPHVIHVSVVSLTRHTLLSTSQPSSCLSSSSLSSTSATSSSRSSTRRSWKTCATPLPMGVRAPTTSSTSPQKLRDL